jgi:hypothetical protein
MDARLHGKCAASLWERLEGRVACGAPEIVRTRGAVAPLRPHRQTASAKTRPTPRSSTLGHPAGIALSTDTDVAERVALQTKTLPPLARAGHLNRHGVPPSNDSSTCLESGRHVRCHPCSIDRSGRRRRTHPPSPVRLSLFHWPVKKVRNPRNETYETH